jgi:hypothetical protein
MIDTGVTEIDIIAALEDITKSQKANLIAIIILAVYDGRTIKKTNDLYQTNLPIELMAKLDVFIIGKTSARNILEPLARMFVECDDDIREDESEAIKEQIAALRRELQKLETEIYYVYNGVNPPDEAV